MTLVFGFQFGRPDVVAAPPDLDLLVALDSRLSRLRVFSFVDGLAEITTMVRDARAAGRLIDPRAAADGAIRLNGGSDYGWVLREFARAHAHQLSRRSVVLGIDEETAVLGMDGVWQVHGRSRVTVWRGRHRDRYRAGETFRP